MRFLVINELRVSGGTEIQTQREIKNLTDHGHQVMLLSFDPKYPLCLDGKEDAYNIPIQFNNIEKFLHRIFRSPKYSRLVRFVIQNVHPDYIHINHAKSIPLDVFYESKDIPTIQTLRDYSFVCPKETCIVENGLQCKGYFNSSCLSCIKHDPKLALKLLTLKNVNRTRLKCVNRLVAPSEALAKTCSNNSLPTSCLNNPFDFTVLKKKKMSFESNNYLYYGEISEKKGINRLITAFSIFNKEFPLSKLIIAGKVTDDFRNIFGQLITGKEYISYVGKLPNSKIMELYEDIFCVVVPSLWIENYPNTVLEAIANRTLVIGSNRGGIPELISDGKFTFDILNEDDIVDKLRVTKELSQEEYKKITDRAFDRILKNNSLETYYTRLMNEYLCITNKGTLYDYK